MASAVSGPTYDENQIQVLDNVEHVRLRPGMYIGDTGVYGLHHMVYEVVDNAVDEAMAGNCRNIAVTIHSDNSVSVEDDGRGFPVGMKAEHGKPAIELCLTVLGAGGKFNREAYKVSGGLHGVGVSVVNFLSETCEVRTRRDGKQWVIGFERGITTRPLTEIGEADTTGSIVRFKPDPQIFQVTEFSYDTLSKRLRDLAYLNSGVRISLRDERSGTSEDFLFENGLREFVEHLNDGKEPLHPVIAFQGEDAQSRLICEVALQYTDNYSELTLSFANNIHTVEGGTHLSGFRTALTRTLNNYARKGNLFKQNDPVPQGEDIREGLTAVISVKLPEPQFEGQTKTKLGNSELGTFVDSVVSQMLGMYLEEHPAEAKRIVTKTVQAAIAREAARKARETARKSALGGGGFSRKLVDCSSRDRDNTEIFIVEGDSAAGSAKGGRDAKTQAILPIRGKILNVEKARLHKVLNHEEILEIIKALGTGIGAEEFDIEKLRYGRIILMTDADVDGSHIRTLLLTFLFRHMRELITKGVVYVAQPPLYELSKGKKIVYALDDGILGARLTELGLERTHLEIHRAGAAPRVLEGAALAELLAAVESIQRSARVLSRRGILFPGFVRHHLRDGRLPRIRVQHGEQEHYFYSDQELQSYLARGGQMATRTELPESKLLEADFARLAEHGCEPADLLLVREELITGERAPAVFVLLRGDSDPVELDNLFALPTGIHGLGSTGWDLKRFKGLGEMNKDQLWATTMDPERRVLRRVVIGQADSDPETLELDAVETDRAFSILMGEDVEKRKNFITANAANVKNLDI